MRLNKIILFLLVLLPYAVIKSQSCPSIKDALGNSDVTITCNYPLNSSKCFPLNITFPDIRDTNQYSVSAIPFPKKKKNLLYFLQLSCSKFEVLQLSFVHLHH